MEDFGASNACISANLSLREKGLQLGTIAQDNLLVLWRSVRVTVESQLPQNIKQQRLTALKLADTVRHSIVEFNCLLVCQREVGMGCKNHPNVLVPLRVVGSPMPIRFGTFYLKNS